MTSEPQANPDPARPVPEAANLGVARPPLVYLSSIAFGVILQFVWPIPVLPRGSRPGLGATVVLLAIGLFLFAIRIFRAAGTPVPGNRPTTTIVRTGPYRFSRNPIYLAFSLLQLGIALWVNSLWVLLTLLASVALMSLVVIPRESGTRRPASLPNIPLTRLPCVAGSSAPPKMLQLSPPSVGRSLAGRLGVEQRDDECPKGVHLFHWSRTSTHTSRK